MRNAVQKCLTLFMISCVMSVPFIHAETVVIVHPDNDIASLSAKEVNRIFLGKSKRDPTTQRAIAISQNKGATAETFNKRGLR